MPSLEMLDAVPGAAFEVIVTVAFAVLEVSATLVAVTL